MVGLLALAALAASYEYCGVLGHWLTLPRYYHPAYCMERPQNVTYPPGVGASPWLPEGTPVEYNYTRVTALFDIRPDYRDAVVFIKSNVGSGRVTVLFGVNAALKTDGRPVLQCLTPVAPRRLGWFDEYFINRNVTCPGDTATVYHIYVWFYARSEKFTPRLTPENTKTGLCVKVVEFSQFRWWHLTGWPNPFVGGVYYGRCAEASEPPRNVTLWARPRGVEIYVDGELFEMLPLTGVFYTGPYSVDMLLTAQAYIDTPDADVELVDTIGTIRLLIGNETVVTPPRYLLKEGISGISYIESFQLKRSDKVIASSHLDWDTGLSVGPPTDRFEYWRGPERVVVRGSRGFKVLESPTVPVVIAGVRAQLPYRSLINVSGLCAFGDAVVQGQYSRIGGWVEIRGPASIHCTKYPVVFRLPNGTAVEVEAEYNKTLVWTPPPIIYNNGTRLEADPVSVLVDGPKAVAVNYSRMYYWVEVASFNETKRFWALRGSELRLPEAVDFGNGTRLVAAGGTSAVVERPLVLKPEYARQHLVRLLAPVNSTEAWADEGSVFVVGLADPWEPGNGTLFARLLVNGTAAREWRVEKPITLTAQYAEVYHWVEVAGFNATRSWVARGAVLRFPAVVDLGNGTRLVGPSVEEVVVDRPAAVRVEYAKRQYHVRIEGVVRWEGWVDAGAAVVLNATVIDGVEYTPAEHIVVNAPGVYRPLFMAAYKTTARDPLGVPNPLAAARLCGAEARAGLDGSLRVVTETREPCRPEVEAAPVSPYTALAAVAVAAAAVALLRKRK